MGKEANFATFVTRANPRRAHSTRLGKEIWAYWMVAWSLFLLELLGSFTSRVLGLGVGMLGAAG